MAILYYIWFKTLYIPKEERTLSPKHVFYAAAHFCGVILNLWPCLVELHEKKAELSQKSYLLKSFKSMSVYKLIVNTFNGFLYQI